MDMKYAHLLILSAAAAAALIFAASKADAQQAGAVGGVARNNFSNHGGGFRGGHRGGLHGGFGFGGVWVVERDYPVVVEREIIREVPVVVEAPPPPPPPRDPYVVGKSYASLPGGCMKIVEPGVSHFYCSGEWYRQVGSQYRAVQRP